MFPCEPRLMLSVNVGRAKLTVLTHQRQLMPLTTWQKPKPNVLPNARDLLPTTEYDGSKRRLLIQPARFGQIVPRWNKRETFYNSIHVVNCLLFIRERNERLLNKKSFRDPLRNLHLVECSRDQISIRIFGLHVSRLCIGQSTIVEKMPTSWNTMTMSIQRVLSHVDVCEDRRNYFFAYTTK